MPDGTDTTPPDSDGNVQVPPRETLEPDAHGGVPEGGRSFFGAIEDQLAIRRVIHQYMIPAGTNTLWYTLGGVLAISLVLEIITGVISPSGTSRTPGGPTARQQRYSASRDGRWRSTSITGTAT